MITKESILISKTATFLKTPAMQWTLTYYALFICLGLSIGLVGPTLPSFADQTQTSVGEMGAVFTASAIGALLGTLLGGRRSIGCAAIRRWASPN